MLSLVSVLVLVLGFLFNVYKFRVLEDCHDNSRSYMIFPWSKNGIPSQSSIIWLYGHLYLALSNLVLTCVAIIVNGYKRTSFMYCLHELVHYLFCLQILWNSQHFGNVPYYYAYLINGITLIVMMTVWSLPRKNKYRLPTYFIIMNIPVVIEILLWTAKF